MIRAVCSKQNQLIIIVIKTSPPQALIASTVSRGKIVNWYLQRDESISTLYTISNVTSCIGKFSLLKREEENILSSLFYLSRGDHRPILLTSEKITGTAQLWRAQFAWLVHPFFFLLGLSTHQILDSHGTYMPIGVNSSKYPGCPLLQTRARRTIM